MKQKNKPTEKQLKHVLSVVRKLAGIKVTIGHSDEAMLGYVTDDAKGQPSMLFVSSSYKNVQGRIIKTNISEQIDTALHELAHILQIRRKDKDYFAQVDGVQCMAVEVTVESGTPVKKSIRLRALKHIYAMERDAEMFSIDMRQRLGIPISLLKEIRRSSNSLIQHILSLKYQRVSSPTKIKELLIKHRFRPTSVPTLDEVVSFIESTNLDDWTSRIKSAS